MKNTDALDGAIKYIESMGSDVSHLALMARAELATVRREREIDTVTLGQLWDVFYAAREVEEYVGANSGSTADWPVQLLARGEAEADRVTAMMQNLQDKIKAVKLNPVTIEDWRRFA